MRALILLIACITFQQTTVTSQPSYSGNYSCTAASGSSAATVVTVISDIDTTATKTTLYSGAPCMAVSLDPLIASYLSYTSYGTTTTTRTYTCITKKATGTACTADVECVTGYCSTTCLAKLSTGATGCYGQDVRCSSFFCNSNTCATPLSHLATCSGDFSLNSKCHPFGYCKTNPANSAGSLCYYYRSLDDEAFTPSSSYCKSGNSYTRNGEANSRCKAIDNMLVVDMAGGDYRIAKSIKHCPLKFPSGTNADSLPFYEYSYGDLYSNSLYNKSDNNRVYWCPYVGTETLAQTLLAAFKTAAFGTLTEASYFKAYYYYSNFINNPGIKKYIDPIPCGPAYEETLIYPLTLKSLSLPLASAMMMIAFIIIMLI